MFWQKFKRKRKNSGRRMRMVITGRREEGERGQLKARLWLPMEPLLASVLTGDNEVGF